MQTVAREAARFATARATTLPEARRREIEPRRDLEGGGAHPDVLAFCWAGLLSDVLLQTVQEAVKSLAARLRARTGLFDHQSELPDRALGGEPPMLGISPLARASERSEASRFPTSSGHVRNVP